jgi:predicted XRE-type DNA-binding protein
MYQFDKFPREVWTEILTFLPYTHLINHVSHVSHHFDDIILGDGTPLWQQLFKYQKFKLSEEGPFPLNFLRKYQVSNIVWGEHKPIHHISRNTIPKESVLKVIETIEPFVTSLKIHNESISSLVVGWCRQSGMKLGRSLFPNLVNLRAKLNLKEMKLLVASDLSRVKYLYIGKDQTFPDDETDLLKMNTLQSVSFDWYTKEHSNMECIESIAPYISTLSVVSMRWWNNKLIVFSKLQKVHLGGDAKWIAEFFKVTHPLLTNVSIEDRFGMEEDIQYQKFAPQPSVRIVKCRISPKLVTAILNAVTQEKLEQLEIESDLTQTIPTSGITNLKSLIIHNFKSHSIVEDIVKRNNLHTLSLNSNAKFNLNPLWSYLQNLTDLKLYTIDEQTLSELLKLPKINSLYVYVVDMPYSTFTRLTHELCALTEVTVSNFNLHYGRNKDPVYIIAPMERLTISVNANIPNIYLPRVQWILAIASTMNVLTVNYSVFMKNILTGILDTLKPLWKECDGLVSVEDCITYDLTKAWNEVLDRNYIEVQDDEKTRVANYFKQMFQKQDIYNMQPALRYLIQEATAFFNDKNQSYTKYLLVKDQSRLKLL